MTKIQITDRAGRTFTRISKAAACRAYMAGVEVWAVPCNFRPSWLTALVLDRESRAEYVTDEIGARNDFYSLVNSFEFYNCTNSETGKYAAFYLMTEPARAAEIRPAQELAGALAA